MKPILSLHLEKKNTEAYLDNIKERINKLRELQKNQECFILNTEIQKQEFIVQVNNDDLSEEGRAFNIKLNKLFEDAIDELMIIATRFLQRIGNLIYIYEKYLEI